MLRVQETDFKKEKTNNGVKKKKDWKKCETTSSILNERNRGESSLIIDYRKPGPEHVVELEANKFIVKCKQNQVNTVQA